MGAVVGVRGFIGTALRCVLSVGLAGALAGGAAVQFAGTGIADPGTPSPTSGRAVTPTPAVAPGPTATTNPATTPSPTTTRSPSATQSPAAPDPSVTATQTPSPEVTGAAAVVPVLAQAPAESGAPVVAAAAAGQPLAVRNWVDNGYVGKPYNAPLVITGGTAPYAVTVSNIPPGLTFDAATLRFVGTPTQEGCRHCEGWMQSFQPNVSVSDSSTPIQTVSLNVDLAIYQYTPPTIEFAYQEAFRGSSYESGPTISTAGLDSLPYTTSVVSGQLPPGLSLEANGHAAGTPTREGKYVFTLRATDKYGHTDAEESITVRPPAPQSTGFVVPVAVLGEPYSARIASVTGGVAPYDFWWSTNHMAGGLGYTDPGPDGLSIDHNGVLNGVPTRAGTFRVQVLFRDQSGFQQEIFTTDIIVLEARPPALQQPPAAAPPPAAAAVPPSPTIRMPEVALPVTAVVPAGEVVPPSSTQLAATGIPSGTLNTVLWASTTMLFLGAAILAATSHRSRQRRRQ